MGWANMATDLAQGAGQCSTVAAVHFCALLCVRLHYTPRASRSRIRGLNSMWATHPASGAWSQHRPHAAEPVWPSRPLCSACAASPGRLQQAATGEAQHARLAAAAPVAVTLPSGLRLARALECGWHPACPPLWPHLLAAGADTSLSCDVPEEQHARAAQAGAGRLHEQGDSGRGCLCGNTPGCSRFLAAHVNRVPSYQGPFSVAHLLFPSFSASMDLAEALAKAALLVAPGGHLVLGAPAGRAAAHELAQRNRETGVQLWRLPEDATALAALIAPLPLTLVALIDEPDFYAAVLQARARGHAHSLLFLLVPNISPHPPRSLRSRRCIACPTARCGLRHPW